jgi:hypothetical protein
MKKILFALFIGIFSITAPGKAAVAQDFHNDFVYTDVKNPNTTARNIASLENPAHLGVYVPDSKNVNTKAVRDFQARFKNVSNTQWYTDQNGYLSYFVLNGYTARASYDLKGHWQYSLICYKEVKLPRDIREIVKTTYYDMAITVAEEVQVPDNMFYILHLEDKLNILIIKVNQQGEMETIDELTKQQ